jgi:hypothetical protein
MFALYRATERYGRRVSLIIAGGLVIRLVVGTVIFWISYLSLPIARSLQFGDGLWFFGSDAAAYYVSGVEFALRGFSAILHVPKILPSFTYTQLLALATYLFGTVTSVGLFINIFAYLGTVLVLLRMVGREQPGWATEVAVAAIAFSPTAILWSLQPLKDTVLFFLVVTAAASLAAIIKWCAARVEKAPDLTILVPFAVLMASIYMIAGIRWYFGFVFWAATSLALFILVFAVSHRRLLTLSIAGITTFAVAQMLLLASDIYMPKEVREFLRPSTMLSVAPRVPMLLLKKMELSRRGFDRLHARTLLRDPVATEPPPPPPVAAAKPPGPPAAPVAKVAATPLPAPPQQASVEKGGATIADKASNAPKPAPDRSVASASVPQHPPAVQPAPATDGQDASISEPPPSSQPAPTTPATMSPATSVAEAPSPALGNVTQPSAAQPQPTPVQAAENTGKGDLPISTFKATRDGARAASTVNRQPRAITPAPTPAPVVARPAPAPPPVVARTEESFGDEKPLGVIPTSLGARLRMGFAAMFVPRLIAEKLGLFSLGGGRGLWAFAEVDTLFFDLVVLVCAYMFFRRVRRESLLDPMLWQIGVMTVTIMGAICYVVSNFGTLMRHRQMVFSGICVLLVVVDRWRMPVVEREAESPLPVIGTNAPPAGA